MVYIFAALIGLMLVHIGSADAADKIRVGVPQQVVNRAYEVLENLEAGSLDPMGLPRLARSRRRPVREVPQLKLFGSDQED